MKKLPVVSVVMPHFNYVEYLIESVESVSKLDYPSLELLVVDDCGPIRASEILKDCRIKNLRIIEHERNLGHVAAKNSGISQASGEFILPLDSDDLLSPSYLQETIPKFVDGKIGVVLTDVNVFGDLNYVCTPAMTKCEFVNLKMPSNTFVARKQLFVELGRYDDSLKYGDESDFLLRVLENGWQIVHVPLPLYSYRKHEQGMSVSISYVKMLEDLLDRHAETFRELYREALLFRERRYWGEQSFPAIESDNGKESDIPWKQYAYLHSEFHKLLAHHNDSQKEVERLNDVLVSLSNGRYFRLRRKLDFLIGKIKSGFTS